MKLSFECSGCDTPSFVLTSSLAAHFNYLRAGSSHLVNACKFRPSTRIAFGRDGGIFTLMFSLLTLQGMICGWKATAAAALRAEKWMANKAGGEGERGLFKNNVSQGDHGPTRFKVFIKIHTLQIQFAVSKQTC